MIQKELQDINPYVRICVCTKTYPGWEIRDRIIYDHEMVLITSGQGRMVLNGKGYKASKGDFFLVRPGILHSLIAEDADPFVSLVVHFDFFYERDRNFWPHKKFLVKKEEYELPESYLLRDVPEFENSLMFSEYIRLNDYTKIEILMKGLLETYDSNKYGRELILKSYLLEILFALLSEQEGDIYLNSSSSCFEKVKDAFDYVNNNYAKKIQLKDLAALCNLSTNYFAALFKKYTGYAPNEYIIRLRIEKAKGLLRKTTDSVSGISEEVGFSDIHYFSFYFKKIEGLSPVHYRMTIGEYR